MVSSELLPFGGRVDIDTSLQYKIDGETGLQQQVDSQGSLVPLK